MLLWVLIAAASVTLGVNSELPFVRQSKAWSGARDDTDGRLPRTLLPYHYNVELFPYIDIPEPPFPFTGRVAIWFECVEATNVITINNDGLSVIDSSISISVAADTPGSPTQPILTEWQHDQDVQFLHFNLDANLVPGEFYVIELAYTGTMNSYSEGQGLYWDTYRDQDNRIVYIVGTQFESIFARKAIPCFDEPDLKATFNVTVVYNPRFKAFSNMPIQHTDIRSDFWVASTYSTSPVMSSYQVCVVIGDYVDVFSGNINGYDVTIWTRPQMRSRMEFAASISAKVQAWLDDVTKQLYPLPKMDHISLPNKGGAMENWGLITYGEQVLAVDPETSPAHARENIASYISHEIAHQWYGNLVTCKWWDDIWLNEGGATYYDYFPMEAVGWEASEITQFRTVLPFLDVDARNNSDPVRKPTPHVQLAPASFGGSTYSKGGAIMLMLSAILTRSSFEKGLARYMDTMKYKNAVTDDLWTALNEQAVEDGLTNPDGSPLDLKARMDPWLNQMGYPLVHIVRSPDGTARVTRSHFLNPPNQIMNTASQWNYEWDVPLTVVTSSSPPEAWDAPPVAWIDINQTETTLTGLPTDLTDWVIVNSKGRMYYRVHYDDASRDAIVAELISNPRAIDGLSKTAFIDDTFTLARALYIPHTAAMETTRYLADEYAYNPWFPAVKHFQSVERLITREPWYGSYRSYVLSLASPVYTTLGWTYNEEDTILQQFLRRDMISVSCSNGLVTCVDTALQEYYVARNNTALNIVNANNLPTVLCTGIQTFTNNWDLWFNEYNNRKVSQIREERYAYLFGLACTNLQANLVSYLNGLIGDAIDNRDKNTAAGYLALNDYGAIILWDYMDNNWDSVPWSGRFTTLTTIANGFNNEYGLTQLNSFIARHPPASQSEINSYTQMIINVEQNIAWLDSNRESLQNWLSQRRDPQELHAIATPLSVSPVHHWLNLMKEQDDSKLY